MYLGDHSPPHFHVRYGSQKARFRIDDLGLIDGHVSPRVRAMVVEWASQHQQELTPRVGSGGEHAAVVPHHAAGVSV